jgi:hypothetical protein
MLTQTFLWERRDSLAGRDGVVGRWRLCRLLIQFNL